MIYIKNIYTNEYNSIALISTMKTISLVKFLH